MPSTLSYVEYDSRDVVVDSWSENYGSRTEGREEFDATIEMIKTNSVVDQESHTTVDGHKRVTLVRIDMSSVVIDLYL